MQDEIVEARKEGAIRDIVTKNYNRFRVVFKDNPLIRRDFIVTLAKQLTTIGLVSTDAQGYELVGKIIDDLEKQPEIIEREWEELLAKIIESFHPVKDTLSGHPLRRRHFVISLIKQLRESGWLILNDDEVKFVAEYIDGVVDELEQKPYLPPDDRSAQESVPLSAEEAVFREQVFSNMSLPQETCGEIRATNQKTGIKVGRLEFGHPKQIDESIVAKFAEFGAKYMAEEAVSFLEVAGFREEYREEVRKIILITMNYVASGVHNYIAGKETTFSKTRSLDAAASKDYYSIYYHGIFENQIILKSALTGVGHVAADLGLGHIAAIGDFFRIIHLGSEELDDADLIFLNQIAVDLKAGATDRQIREFDQALSVFGLHYSTADGLYKK